MCFKISQVLYQNGLLATFLARQFDLFSHHCPSKDVDRHLWATRSSASPK